MPHWTFQSWRRVLVLLTLAGLLGRASIEHVVSPFGLAYYVILTELVGHKRNWPAYAAIAGAWSIGGLHAGLLMLLQFGIFVVARRWIFKKKTVDMRWIPLIAGFDAFISNLFMFGTEWTKYNILLSLSDGALVTILSLIFIQCMAIFVGQEHSKILRNEQIVSLVILVGSMITGLSGLEIHGVSFAQVAVDWIILMIACGGMGVSTAGAIVVSILALLDHNQSLSTVAVCGFAGLLAGLLKDTNRIWIGISFIGTTTVLSVASTPTISGVLSTSLASLVAVGLYWLTPKRLLREFAAYVPGTSEHKKSEQERVHRINKLLTEKIHEVSQVFEELSVTFADTGQNQFTSTQQLVTHVVGSAGQQVCGGCPRKTRCWDKEGFQTYQAMVQTVSNIENHLNGRAVATPELKERCIRLDSMLGVLRYNLELTNRDAKWIAKLEEHKTLVSAQLSGVADVVQAIAEEMMESSQSALSDEEHILAALEQLGLFVDHVHIVSLEPGKVEIEIVQPVKGAYENSSRVIAPLLSGIVGENISVARVSDAATGMCTSIFSSSRLFNVKTAVATVARDGRIVSGDTYTTMDLGNGRFAIAVSDGMGNGERARRESKAAIELLKKLLKAGFNEKLSIQTVNSTLLLRSKDEMFTTLDMALIDLYTAQTQFLKIGSAPSFILREGHVSTLTGANVPIGILQDIEFQAVTEQLQNDDILIMLSDGVYDAPGQSFDKEVWLRQQIEAMTTRDPEAIADLLLEAAVRVNEGAILDDMTVVVAVICKHEPEWATIKLPGVSGLRKKTEAKRQGA